MIENLYDKRTGKRVTIYAVGEDSNGYPKFLIREKNRWVWQSAKYYITEEENLLKKLQKGSDEIGYSKDNRSEILLL